MLVPETKPPVVAFIFLPYVTKPARSMKFPNPLPPRNFSTTPVIFLNPPRKLVKCSISVVTPSMTLLINGSDSRNISLTSLPYSIILAIRFPTFVPSVAKSCLYFCNWTLKLPNLFLSWSQIGNMTFLSISSITFAPSCNGRRYSTIRFQPVVNLSHQLPNL